MAVPNTNVATTSYVQGAYDALDAAKQDVIDSTHKLSADLVDDSTSTNKFVTASDKTTWNGKQDALTTAQQNAVDSGITAGKVSTYDGYATTKQDTIDSTHKLSADLVDDSTSTNKFVTASDKTTWNGKQDLIDSTHKLSADLVQDGTTNKVVTAAEKTAWDAKLSTVTVDNTGVSSGNPAPVVTNVSASNGTITVTRQDLAVPVKNSNTNSYNGSATIWFE